MKKLFLLLAAFTINVAANAQNKIVEATGGSALVLGKAPFINNTYFNVRLSEKVDTQNAYDPSTGIFTAPADGQYLIFSSLQYIVIPGGKFDGSYSNVRSFLLVDNISVAGDSKNIFRGGYIPGGPPITDLISNITLHLEKDQQVELKTIIYGDKGASDDANKITIDRAGSFLRIYKF